MPLTDPDAARGTPASPGLFGLLGIYALRAAAWLSIGLPRQGEPDAFRQGDHQAPMATQNIQTVTGTVEQVNDNGFKLNNSNWVNYSQYGYHGPKYQPYTPAPQPGQVVTIQIKNDRFVHALAVAGTALPTTPQAATNGTAAQAPAAPAPQPMALPATNNQDKLIDATIKARLELLRTAAVANASLFTLENCDTLTELVRNLEQFVLEDLIAATTPVTEDDVEIDDVIEDEV